MDEVRSTSLPGATTSSSAGLTLYRVEKHCLELLQPHPNRKALPGATTSSSVGLICRNDWATCGDWIQVVMEYPCSTGWVVGLICFLL